MYLNTVFKYNVFKYCPALSIVSNALLKSSSTVAVDLFSLKAE